MKQIFVREVNPLIPEIFHGSNATVLAYGATGSGKTFTMQVGLLSISLRYLDFRFYFDCVRLVTCISFLLRDFRYVDL